jgi:Mg2+ and Co2+ transporter CorA
MKYARLLLTVVFDSFSNAEEDEDESAPNELYGLVRRTVVLIVRLTPILMIG